MLSVQQHDGQGSRIAQQAEQQVTGCDLAVGGVVRGVLGCDDGVAGPRCEAPEPLGGV